MTHANHYFESKLERECPKALPYFREYLTAMNGSLYLLGVGGESAYYWALQKVKEETQMQKTLVERVRELRREDHTLSLREALALAQQQMVNAGEGVFEKRTCTHCNGTGFIKEFVRRFS